MSLQSGVSFQGKVICSYIMLHDKIALFEGEGLVRVFQINTSSVTN